jgi:hypothetical protein
VRGGLAGGRTSRRVGATMLDFEGGWFGGGRGGARQMRRRGLAVLA